MAGHSLSVTDECPVCGGPCKEPFRQSPVHENYPFMTPEQIRMTQEINAPPREPTTPDPGVPEKQGKRMRRLREDRAHRPAEDRGTA